MYTAAARRGACGAGAVGLTAVPADDRGVVVGGGVDHHVLAERPRAAIVVVVFAEAELEHADAGEGKVIAQLLDIRGDDAEVFGDKARLGRLRMLAQRLEQGAAGGGNPAAELGGLGVAGDLPMSGE